MNQIVLGAAIPYAIAVVVYLCRGCRASLAFLILAPMAMLAGAVWAVIPDIPRLTGNLDLYNRLALDPRINAFFWHFTMDSIESDSPWPAAVFVLMCLSLLAVAWNEVRRAEADSHPSPPSTLNHQPSTINPQPSTINH